MYVYLQSEPSLWTVGFYDPQGNWHPESDYSSTEDAAKRVAYLNGETATLQLEDVESRLSSLEIAHGNLCANLGAADY